MSGEAQRHSWVSDGCHGTETWCIRCDQPFTAATDAEPCEQRQKPQDWAASDGRYILDPDGWREPGAPPFDRRITRADYDRRIVTCTVGPAPVVASVGEAE